MREVHAGATCLAPRRECQGKSFDVTGDGAKSPKRKGLGRGYVFVLLKTRNTWIEKSAYASDVWVCPLGPYMS